MSNFKNQVEEILNKHLFVDTEHKSVFEAMSEILELVADRIEEREPHAKFSIERYRTVARDIYDMDDFIEENS